MNPDRSADPAGVPTLDHAGIAALIPHAGRMCLLERLLAWDASTLQAQALSHRDPHNPLRSASGLLATAAIEYAAQAMALHGALLARAGGGTARPGFLASARGVDCQRLRLDDLAGPLLVAVQRQAGDERQLLYAFTVSHADEVVVAGRVAVVLNTPLAITS